MDVFQLKRLAETIDKYGYERTDDYRQAYPEVIKVHYIHHENYILQAHVEIKKFYNPSLVQIRRERMGMELMQYVIIEAPTFKEVISWRLTPNEQQPPYHIFKYPHLTQKIIYSFLRKYKTK